MNARRNCAHLERPIHVRHGACAVDLCTIGDAANFIVILPADFDGRLHWALAGSTLEAASREPNNVDLKVTATLAMENALATEGMLCAKF